MLVYGLCVVGVGDIELFKIVISVGCVDGCVVVFGIVMY